MSAKKKKRSAERSWYATQTDRARRALYAKLAADHARLIRLRKARG